MKKILAALLLLMPATVMGQAAVWWESNTITTNTRGTTIAKNDTVALVVKLNPNFSTIRSIYFDFQHQKDAIQFLSVDRGAGIPQAATFSVQNYYYPNCKFNRTAQNTTDNGWNNWMNANYTCNAQTVPYHAINRVMVNVASAANLDHATYVTLKFRITNTTAGFPYDSVYMNFAVGYDAAGSTMTNTLLMSGAKGVWIQLNPTANNLITGNIKHGTNISSGLQSMMRLSVTDTATPPVEATNATVGTSGNFGFAQQLQTNSWYRLRLMVPGDSVSSVSKAATTISDYTTAVQEFITQNLDKTYKNNNINAGIKYWAADVNNNGEFDGGDVQKLFNAVVGLDTIVKAPVGCSGNCMVSLSIFYGTEYDSMPLISWDGVMTGKMVDITPGQTEWAIITPNGYGAGQSRVYVDMRQFPNGVTPSSVKWMNILDVYNGPVTFMSSDASWAFYKVASSFTKATNGSSAYNSSIRNVNNTNTDYAINSTVTFSNKTPSFVPARTTTGEQIFDVRYAFKGDVNLSHSSAITVAGNAAAVQMMKSSNVAYVSSFGNFVVPNAASVDVNLNNSIVTSNNITIPFTLDTKSVKLTGLQFEVKYDPAKVKFEKLEVNTPSWVSFVGDKDGVIRFGALDKDLKNTLSGSNLVPFKLVFSSVAAGVDLNTAVQIYPTMDATDDKGNQVGITFNTNVIKLIGANFFRQP